MALGPRNEEKRDMLNNRKKPEPLAAQPDVEKKVALDAEKDAESPKAAETKPEVSVSGAKAEKAAAVAIATVCISTNCVACCKFI